MLVLVWVLLVRRGSQLLVVGACVLGLLRVLGRSVLLLAVGSTMRTTVRGPRRGCWLAHANPMDSGGTRVCSRVCRVNGVLLRGTCGLGSWHTATSY